MKIKALLLCMALLSATNVFAQSEKLTNQSISDMIELGFSESIIMTKIQTSEVDFDISMEALKALKEKGVPENIIVAIMNVAQKKSEDESKEPQSGIYYQINQKTKKKILPTVFSGTKTNTLGAAFSYGIASSKVKALLNNAQSPNIIKVEDDMAFIFYFVPQEDHTFRMGASNWWFRSATSPNEFVLVKLSVKKGQRELVIGKVNAYAGSSSSIDAKATIPFAIESINEHTFKITPVEPLEPGEYCFVYQGMIPSGCSNQSVFDFSIQE